VALIENASPDDLHTCVVGSNLDGHCDKQDLVTVFIAGQYLTEEPAGWLDGDWHGNGVFNEKDFIPSSLPEAIW